MNPKLETVPTDDVVDVAVSDERVVVSMTPFFVRTKNAAALLGSLAVLRYFEAADWIKPMIQGNRLTVYSIAQLQGCVRRVENGEVPALLRRPRKS